MPSSQEDRERFAPLFGWTGTSGNWLPPFELIHRYKQDMIHGTICVRELPDFCDIREPYFGPACEKLSLSGWFLAWDDGQFIWRQSFVREPMLIGDPDLGRCTMLALEAQERMKKC